MPADVDALEMRIRSMGWMNRLAKTAADLRWEWYPAQVGVLNQRPAQIGIPALRLAAKQLERRHRRDLAIFGPRDGLTQRNPHVVLLAR